MPPRSVGMFRLHIDGSWTAGELSSLMRSLEDIYNLSSLLSSRNFKRRDAAARLFPLNRLVIRRLAQDVASAGPLMVPQFRYASPGFADFLGAGKGLKHLKEFIFGITDRIIDTTPRRLKNESTKIENDKRAEELRIMKREGEAAHEHSSKMQTLTLREQQLRNELLAEEVQAARIRNIDTEITLFSSSISKLMNLKELSGEEQARIVHWIGTRAHPLAELVGSGKLRGAEDLDEDVKAKRRATSEE